VPLSWFAARHPEKFAPDRFPIFIRRTDVVEIYGAPSVDGVSVKVASAVGSSPVDDPDHVERRHARAEISVMSQAVGELLSGLPPPPGSHDSFTDLYSSDGTPRSGGPQPGGGYWSPPASPAAGSNTHRPSPPSSPMLWWLAPECHWTSCRRVDSADRHILARAT